MATVRRLRAQIKRPVRRLTPAKPRRTFGTELERIGNGPLRIFITGGVGDWFVLESWMTPTERLELQEIYFASPQSVAIESTLPAMDFPNLKLVKTLWSDFSQRFAFTSKAEAVAVGVPFPDDHEQIVDWSIGAAFRAFRMRRKLTGSTLLTKPVADISKFKLPRRYHFVAPFSTDKRSGIRDFGTIDWEAVYAKLHKDGAFGVIVYRGPECPPAHELMIDLTNQTTVLEATEILKHAIGYLGIDTCFSVLAAQHFPADKFFVKTTSGHLIRNQRVYYAPLLRFDRVTVSMQAALQIEQRHR